MKERAIQRWETDGGEIPNEVSQPNGIHEAKVRLMISR
jgi:hypothetical protein